MDPHFSCSNYAFKSRTCSKKTQNKPRNLSVLRTVGDAKQIPRMRGMLNKSLVPPCAPSRARRKITGLKLAGQKKAHMAKTMWAWVTTSFVVCHPKCFYGKGILGAVCCCVAFCLFHLNRFCLCIE